VMVHGEAIVPMGTQAILGMIFSSYLLVFTATDSIIIVLYNMYTVNIVSVGIVDLCLHHIH
ncbi:hypothetical protein V3C99_016142, partial [Haemonchus contortus]